VHVFRFGLPAGGRILRRGLGTVLASVSAFPFRRGRSAGFENPA